MEKTKRIKRINNYDIFCKMDELEERKEYKKLKELDTLFSKVLIQEKKNNDCVNTQALNLIVNNYFND